MGVETDNARKAAVREKGAAIADLDCRTAIEVKLGRLSITKETSAAGAVGDAAGRIWGFADRLWRGSVTGADPLLANFGQETELGGPSHYARYSVCLAFCKHFIDFVSHLDNPLTLLPQFPLAL